MGHKRKYKLQIISTSGFKLLGLMILFNIVPQAKAGCGKPPDVPNSSLQAQFFRRTSFENGDPASYRCNTGYSVKGKTYLIKCLNNNWTPAEFSCEPKNCGFPGEGENGYWEGESFTFGTSIVFVCYPGFVIAGRDDSRTCQADGTWSNDVPVCEPVRCEDPEGVENGKVSVSSDLEFDSVATYSCHKGFSLIGSATSLCTADRTWSKSAPICKEVKCLRPPQISNGQAMESLNAEYVMNSQVVYECQKGYIIKGSATITCLQTNTWSDLPVCDAVCEKGITIDRANSDQSYYTTDYYVIGQQIRFTCKPGFKDRNRETLTTTCSKAENRAVWIPATETFKCEKPCPPFPDGNYDYPQLEYVLGRPTGKTFFADDYVELKCIDGYKDVSKTRFDDFRVRCTQSYYYGLQWETKTFSCKRFCGHPGSPRNGRTYGNRYFEENEVQIRCDRGYRINGQPEVYSRCLENGQWSVPVSDCEVVNCGKPKFDHGRCSGKSLRDYEYDKSLICTCDAGYYKRGDMYCHEKGEWSSASCTAVSCGSPSRIYNGHYTGREYTFGKSVTYTCQEGFELVGSATAVCQEDRRWSIPVPQCIRKSCKPLSPLAHGRKYNDEDIRVGSQVQFACDTGYMLKGIDTIECLPTQEWSREIPTCEPLVCDLLDIPNGNMDVGQQIEVNAYVTYSCNENFVLVGDRRLQCLPTGKLSGIKPRCKMSDSCDDPPVVGNAEAIVNNQNFKSGVTVTYRCKPGFVLADEEKLHTIVCQLSSQGSLNWSQPSIKCKQIACFRPEAVEHAQFHGDNFTFGDTVTYECNKGFKIKGNASSECLANGNWSNNPPTCISQKSARVHSAQSCEELTDISNGRVQVDENDPSTATYVCDVGYLLEGTSERKCKNSKWSRSEPNCKKICPIPDHINNGEVKVDNENARRIVYSCKKGFVIFGSNRRTCSPEGRWSGMEPTCRVPPANECGSPPTIPNANLIPAHKALQAHSVNTDVRYQCKQGYMASTSSSYTVSCREGDTVNTWSSPRLTCTPKVCSSPGEIENGYLNGNVFTFQSKVYYFCNEGYTIQQADTVLECQHDGSWSYPTPTCEPITCNTPTQKPNIVINYPTRLEYGSTITYTCANGMTLQGPSQRTCQRYGNWSGWDPVCVASCPPPLEPTDGSWIGSDYSIGSSVQLQCNNGFITDGADKQTCQENQKWHSSQTPKCKRMCDHLTEDPYGYTLFKVGPPFGAGVRLRVNCKNPEPFPGYNLECRANGQWFMLGKDQLYTPDICGGFCERPPKQDKATLARGVNVEDVNKFGTNLYYNCQNYRTGRYGYYLTCGKDYTDSPVWRNDCGQDPCCL